MDTKSRKPKVSNSTGVDFINEYNLSRLEKDGFLSIIQYETDYIRLRNLRKKLVISKPLSGKERIRIESEAKELIAIEEDQEDAFFTIIENAICSYQHDRSASKTQTTIGQSLTKLERIVTKANDLKDMLETIDPISEKEIMYKGISLSSLPKMLLELVDVIDNRVYENIEERKSLNKSIHPLRVLSRHVIDALDVLDVLRFFKAKKEKVKIIGELMIHIIDFIDDRQTSDEDSEGGHNHTNLYRYINEELGR